MLFSALFSLVSAQNITNGNFETQTIACDVDATTKVCTGTGATLNANIAPWIYQGVGIAAIKRERPDAQRTNNQLVLLENASSITNKITGLTSGSNYKLIFLGGNAKGETVETTTSFQIGSTTRDVKVSGFKDYELTFKASSATEDLKVAAISDSSIWVDDFRIVAA